MTDVLPAVPLDAIADGPTPTQSVADKLRAQYQKTKARTSVDVLIPGYESLYGTFRAIRDYDEMYETVDPKAKQHLTEQKMTFEIALDMIAAACQKVFADVDGQHHEWHLGVELYDALFPKESDDEARPQTDREAIVMLFPGGTASIVTFAQQLQLWQNGKLQAIDGELVGN